MDERPTKLTIIIGANGTGKTTILRNILEKSGQRALVITPDPIEWLHLDEVELTSPDEFLHPGMVKHVFNPSAKNGTLQKLKFWKDGIMVFDDCRAYLKASTADEIHALLVRRRQRMVDVFAVGHGFNEIPPVFFTFATEIILFETTDNIVRRKDCLKDYDLMVKYQQEVNRMAKNNPHYFKVIKFR